jgi:hypothetical protein
MNAHNRIDVGMSQLLALVTVGQNTGYSFLIHHPNLSEPFDFIVRQLQGIDGPDRIYQQHPCSTTKDQRRTLRLRLNCGRTEMFFCTTVKARGIEPTQEGDDGKKMRKGRAFA